MYVCDGQIIDINLPQVVGGNQYPAGWFLDPERRAACGIVDGVAVGPSFDPATQRAQELLPVEIDGVWTQQWEIVNLTGEEIIARRKAIVPKSVTMRQARRALLAASLLATVNSTVAGLAGAVGDAARIDWEFAQEVYREWPLLVQLAQQIGLSDDQLDALFVTAATL